MIATANVVRQRLLASPKFFESKILPVSDCAPWIISQFRPNLKNPKIDRGRGILPHHQRFPKPGKRVNRHSKFENLKIALRFSLNNQKSSINHCS
jgi:hypothetical protein